MHSLSFKRREDGWDIYLLGHNKPIGAISPTSPEGWFGKMTLDGHLAGTFGNTPQTIVDEFETWVTDGMPLESPLLKWDIKKALELI